MESPEAHRTWDGARNLLDLGGLPLPGGTHTAPGRVWRSGATEWITDAGWAAAREAGLTRVVDLRNPPERVRRDHHPRLAGDPGVEVVHAPVEDPDDTDYLAECGQWLDHPLGWTPTLRRFPDLVAAALVAVADAPGPVLLHCAGGRDRTGLLSAMLLRLAGAEPPVVAEDYARGWRGAEGWAGHHPAEAGQAYDPETGGWVEQEAITVPPAELEQQVADRVPIVHEWCAVTDVEAYLADAGVGAERIDRLRGLLR